MKRVKRSENKNNRWKYRRIKRAIRRLYSSKEQVSAFKVLSIAFQVVILCNLRFTNIAKHIGNGE